MKPIFILAIALLLFAACKKDTTTINLNKGLVVDIALDGNAFESISGTTGNIYKAVATADRKNNAGKAMQFNNADSSYISFENLAGASFPENIFTISFWVNFADTNSAMAVLSKRNPFGPYEYSIDSHFGNSTLKFDNWIDNGGNTVYGIDPLDAAAPITPNQWQHIVFTADGNELKAYKNGVLQQGIDYRISGNTFSATDVPFVIGNGGGWNRNYFFSGKVDEIKMYNRVLSEKEISKLATF